MQIRSIDQEGYMNTGLIKTNLLIGTLTVFAFALSGCGGANSSQVTNSGAAGNGVVNANAANNSQAANNPPATANYTAGNANGGSPGKCTLTKAPDVSGFSIGQTIELLETKYPGFKAAYDKEHTTGIEGNKKANFVLLTSADLPKGNELDKKHPNLSFIWHFLDGKLMAIVEKDMEPEVPDEKKYVEDTAKKYGLPTDGWEMDRDGSGDLACSSFTVMVTTGGQPGVGIMITDTQALQLKESRMK